MNYYITGPLGSNRHDCAARLARRLAERERQPRPLVDLDRKIEEKEDLTIRRLCMMMGEHAYRNDEYELLEDCDRRGGLIVICGDGTLLDPMSRELMERGEILIADAALDPEQLWEQACRDDRVPYAFWMEADEAGRRQKFLALVKRRQSLYAPYIRKAENSEQRD
ncbi:MAG: shikimate kinase [Anaerovoracaceae bacterium]|jgi:shikimate kinase